MLKFIPLKFRENEAYIKSFFACKRCNQASLPPKLYLGICKNTLIDNPDLDQLLYYCESCIKEVNFRCDCDEKCEIIESEEFLYAYNFYRIPCFKHKDKDSISYTKKFVPLCKDCADNDLSMEEKISLTYSSLSQSFFELYQQFSNYRQLSNDRRQKMVTYSCHEMLNACRWMYQLKNGILCEEHPNEKAEFITDELKGLCRICLQRNPRNCPLANISQTSQTALEITKSNKNHNDPYLVNKYLIEMLRFNKHTSITTSDQLNLLLLECRDLLNNKKYNYARCVNCFVKLTEGWNRGISLECGHAACFKCIFNKSFTNCPIDNQEIIYKSFLNSNQDRLIDKSFLNSNQDRLIDKSFLNSYQVRLMHCHTEHLFEPGKEVYKLPCFHSSCEEHYKMGYCFQCGFKFDLWKTKEKSLSKLRTEIQSFYELKCTVHNIKANKMKIHPLSFLCEECDIFQGKNDDNKIWNIETIKHIVIKCIISDFETKKLEITKSAKNYNLSNELIKLFTYLNMKNLGSRSLAISFLRILTGQRELILSKSTLFFNENFEPKIWNRKKYFLNNKTSVVLNFKLNSDTILTGIIIGNLAMPYILPLEIVHYAPILLKINYYQEESSEIIESKEISYFSPYPNDQKTIEIEHLKEKLRVYNFHQSVYLPSSKMNYELIVEINPGCYFFSKPMSKLKIPFLKFLNIKRKTNIPGPVINGSISSPLFGLCVAEVDSTIKKFEF